MSEELYIFVERYAHFSNLHTIYRDLLSGHYKPSVNVNPRPEEWDITNVSSTMMLVLYAYFHSLIEDDPQALNGFRIWRESWPEEEKAIAAVEAQVDPLRPSLRLFRNRVGFHGSRSRDHEKAGRDFFAQYSGTDVWNAMMNFKSLGAALFAKDVDRQKGLDPSRARQWIDRIAARCK
ncbi:MAG: hypothetical protein WA188_01505 [Terriglobales bacterium]